jgi:hypothetical protein
MAEHGSLAKTSLIAALVQVCFGALAISPEAFGLARISPQFSAFDWVSSGLLLFESLAIAAFLWMVYRHEESLNASRTIGLAALTAAVLLSIENLPYILGTVRNLSHSNDVFLWRNNPLRYASYELVPTIPSLAVVSLVVFLALVYRTSLSTSAQPAEQRRNWGLRNACGLWCKHWCDGSADVRGRDHTSCPYMGFCVSTTPTRGFHRFIGDVLPARGHQAEQNRRRC